MQRVPRTMAFDSANRYNIEAMAEFLPVQTFFSHVYLVDLSPSLCDVARKRFERLGWENVSVICQDARSFILPKKDAVTPNGGADVITMSYSLSMIPGQHRCIQSPSLVPCLPLYRLLQRCRLSDIPAELDGYRGSL